FFSTHILSDVEAITDRVAIVARGTLVASGTPRDLVKRTLLGVDVLVRIEDTAKDSELTEGATRVRRSGDQLSLTLSANDDVDAWIERAHAAGAKIISIAPRHETLEDLFLREVAATEKAS